MNKNLFLDFPFRVEVVKSLKRRKTIALKFDSSDNLVKILAPEAVSLKYIKTLLEDRQAWVQEKLKTAKEKTGKLYQNNEIFYVFGKKFTLALEPISNPEEPSSDTVFIKDNKLICQAQTQEKIQIAIKGWYLQAANKILIPRTEHFAKIMGVKYQDIKIQGYKSRWGGCSTKDKKSFYLSYNYRIVLAPLECIDYLIIHELCHIKHMNHSKEFWNLVEHYCPNHTVSKKWLKDNHDKLEL